jgi:hypothetical protein
MATWLHEPEPLSTLADETGPVAHWARLQRLARGLPAAFPTDWITAGPALALRAPGLDAALHHFEDDALGPLARAVLHLGVSPNDANAWRSALESRLDGPNAAHAADVLLCIGQLRRADLPRLIRAARASPTLPAWVLATTPPDQLHATAAELAEGLRDDLASGGNATLASLLLLNGGHLGPSPDDAIDAASRGVGLAEGGPGRAGAIGVTVPKGSTRARTAAVVEGLADGLAGPVAAWVRAIARLRKGPPVPAPAVQILAWTARFRSSGDPWDDVRRGLRGHAAVAAARDVISAGAELPERVHTPTDAALCAEALKGDRRQLAAELLRDADPFEDGTDLARFAAASVCPDIAVTLLDDGSRRDQGIAMAALAPTEEVLERLLRAHVPAHPSDRRNLAWALARTGVPAALPVLRALRGHLEPRVVSEVNAQVRSILGQEL